MDNNIKKFLDDIHGVEEQINFICVGSYPQKVNGIYSDKVDDILKQLNEQNFEIYHIVNQGGYKDKEINRFNAVFIDCDCGRDGNNQYYSLDVVTKYKEQKYKDFYSFALIPSYIIDTRNGYHVYYLLNSGTTEAQFKQAELGLIQLFKGDTKVKNPSNPMRVPGFFWCKNPNDKYLSTIIENNNIRYDVTELLSNLPPIDEVEVKKTNDKKKCSVYCSSSNASNYELIKNKDIKQIQELLNPETVEFNCHEDVYNYLKEQDLCAFLGLPSSNFRCLFHNDEKPSAGIIQNNETGHYIYCCQSENCGFKGTIIQVTEKITGLNRVEALRFLRKVYKVEYKETDWQLKKRLILEENQRFLHSYDFRDFNPETYRVISNYLPQLYFLNGLARDYICTDNFCDSQGNPLFFCSMRHLSEKTGKSVDGISKQIGLFSYLGLVNKLPDEQIPSHLLKEANRQARKKNQYNRVTFMSIPSYCCSTLEFSKLKANEYKNNGFTMKGFGRELILRTLGEKEANRVYPQMKGKPIPLINQEVADLIDDIVTSFVRVKGWTTEQEIMDNLELSHRNTKEFKHTQIKRGIGEILANHDYKKARLNKDLRNKLGIEDDGRYMVIYKE